jgi:hypothetical protein
MNMIITVKMIRESVNTVFIFGDNLERWGTGGQAKVARRFVECGKTFGIPTKRKPRKTPDVFFSDRPDEIQSVKKSFTGIRELKTRGKRIVFFPGIGEGMAELPKRSPRIYAMIKQFIMAFDDHI